MQVPAHKLTIRLDVDCLAVSQLWRQLPGKEAEVVRGCLDQISRAISSVAQSSTAALERTVGDTSRKVDESLIQGHAIMATITEVSTDVKSINSKFSDAAQKVIESNHKTYAALEQISTAFSDLKRQIAEDQTRQPTQIAFSGSQTGLPWQQAPVNPPRLLMAVDSCGLGTPNSSFPRALTAGPFVPFLPPPPPQRSVDDILNSLHVPGGAADEVLDKVEFKARQLQPCAVTRGGYLMEMERFQDWLRTASSASDLILVDGHCSDVTVENVSPLTAISASLIGILRARPSVVTLYHFCGQHIGYRDPLRGPGGLMRHLVHQLLCQVFHHPPRDSSPGVTQAQPVVGLIHGELLADMDLENHDISTLCRLAENLILRLDPSRPVFCIIDSICLLETALDGWRNDTRLVIDTLLGLVSNTARRGPGLKVLLTCTERSIDLIDWVLDSDRHMISLMAARFLSGGSPQPLHFQQIVDDLLMLDDEMVDDHTGSAYSSQVGRGQQ